MSSRAKLESLPRRMANYDATTCTNNFSVTDPEKLAQLVSRMSAEDTVELFDDGDGKYGFGCYSGISGLFEKDEDGTFFEPDYDFMCEELQKILVDGDATIIMETGNEKMRYVGGYGTIITRDAIEAVSFHDCLLGKAREMLGNAAFCTSMDY